MFSDRSVVARTGNPFWGGTRSSALSTWGHNDPIHVAMRVLSLHHARGVAHHGCLGEQPRMRRLMVVAGVACGDLGHRIAHRRALHFDIGCQGRHRVRYGSHSRRVAGPHTPHRAVHASPSTFESQGTFRSANASGGNARSRSRYNGGGAAWSGGFRPWGVQAALAPPPSGAGRHSQATGWSVRAGRALRRAVSRRPAGSVPATRTLYSWAPGPST